MQHAVLVCAVLHSCISNSNHIQPHLRTTYCHTLGLFSNAYTAWSLDSTLEVLVHSAQTATKPENKATTAALLSLLREVDSMVNLS